MAPVTAFLRAFTHDTWELVVSGTNATGTRTPASTSAYKLKPLLSSSLHDTENSATYAVSVDRERCLEVYVSVDTEGFVHDSPPTIAMATATKTIENNETMMMMMLVIVPVGLEWRFEFGVSGLNISDYM